VFRRSQVLPQCWTVASGAPEDLPSPHACTPGRNSPNSTGKTIGVCAQHAETWAALAQAQKLRNASKFAEHGGGVKNALLHHRILDTCALNLRTGAAKRALVKQDLPMENTCNARLRAARPAQRGLSQPPSRCILQQSYAPQFIHQKSSVALLTAQHADNAMSAAHVPCHNAGFV